jgi:tetratricopeptide (TPR) repeat protein
MARLLQLRSPPLSASHCRLLAFPRTLSDQSACFGKRGAAYLDSGKPDEALADLNRAIELNPAYLLALQYRSRLYLERKLYAQAIADCDAALRMNPSAIWTGQRKNEARNAIAGVTAGRSDLTAAPGLRAARHTGCANQDHPAGGQLQIHRSPARPQERLARIQLHALTN